MKIKNMAASGLSGRIFYGTMETKDGRVITLAVTEVQPS